uniref:Dopamine receptor D4 n=1 Tax=Macrostomum lignano TaxID=282301 RepID=A0A1I8FEN2_9PLAT
PRQIHCHSAIASASWQLEVRPTRCSRSAMQPPTRPPLLPACCFCWLNCLLRGAAPLQLTCRPA